LNNSPPPTFPEWVPPPVREVTRELNTDLAKEKDPVKARDVLWRLVSNPLMNQVWREVFRKKRAGDKPTEEYLNPAFTYALRVAAFRQKASDHRGKGDEVNVREAESLEAAATLLEAEAKVMKGEFDPLVHPRWTRQERAAQILLQHAYRTALDDEPVFRSSLIIKTNDLRRVAKEMQKGAEILQSHNLTHEAGKLKNFGEEIEEEANNEDPYFDPETGQSTDSPRFPYIDNPWVLVRGTADVPVRSFVICLSITTVNLFGKALYSTLANIANVVFERDDVTDGSVREILRSRPERAD
jgi:hypothetical protein